jgi:hypothetical protein
MTVFFCPAFSQSQPSLWPGFKADKLALLLTKPLEPFLNASRGLFFERLFYLLLR